MPKLFQIFSIGPDEPPKYLTFKTPLTGEQEYYRQLGPIYGENAAPVRWEQTIVPWLESQGFEPGHNDPCVFYHPGKDLLILLYVDDILCDGEEDDIKWFFKKLSTKHGGRFECKEPAWLSIDTPIDHLGMEIIMDESRA